MAEEEASSSEQVALLGRPIPSDPTNLSHSTAKPKATLLSLPDEVLSLCLQSWCQTAKTDAKTMATTMPTYEPPPPRRDTATFFKNMIRAVKSAAKAKAAAPPPPPTSLVDVANAYLSARVAGWSCIPPIHSLVQSILWQELHVVITTTCPPRFYPAVPLDFTKHSSFIRTIQRVHFHCQLLRGEDFETNLPKLLSLFEGKKFTFSFASVCLEELDYVTTALVGSPSTIEIVRLASKQRVISVSCQPWPFDHIFRAVDLVCTRVPCSALHINFEVASSSPMGPELLDPACRFQRIRSFAFQSTSPDDPSSQMRDTQAALIALFPNLTTICVKSTGLMPSAAPSFHLLPRGIHKLILSPFNPADREWQHLGDFQEVEALDLLVFPWQIRGKCREMFDIVSKLPLKRLDLRIEGKPGPSIWTDVLEELDGAIVKYLEQCELQHFEVTYISYFPSADVSYSLFTYNPPLRETIKTSAERGIYFATFIQEHPMLDSALFYD